MQRHNDSIEQIMEELTIAIATGDFETFKRLNEIVKQYNKSNKVA